MFQKNFASIRRVMRFNDSGRVLALSSTAPFALYDEPAGGTPPVPPADKTFTQAEVDAQIAGLKSKNTELLTKMQAANARVKDLPDDATPEEIKEAIENQRKSKQEQLEAKGKYDELTRQMGDKHTTEKKALEDKVSGLTQRIQTREKRLAIADSLRELDGDVELLTPHILAQLDVEEDGDDYIVFVKDKKGNAVVGADGKKKTVGDLVKEMAENPKYAGAFKAPNVGGSGGRGGGGGRTTASGDVILTNEAAKDVATYRKARAEADKAGGQVIIRG